ncbi:hydroxyethylthiazole kinase [Desulfolucanica intricata]|uniref:hydroxyethylthiazole kinase n=1 Tax=Desulfolucanica intricata TaxID=1285191 RepID=UPI000830D4D1|nr:hydroxyethylthiazole kinase [Desulfolucanica intricata]
MLNEIWSIITDVRQQKPLIQSITNYVTINDCANILLSFGASPAMCEIIEEVEGFVNLADGLYINIGTLAGEQKKAISLAVAKADELNKPVVIDPVGVGAIPSRLEYVLDFMGRYNISIVKGNLGEIKVLAGMEARICGVDSLEDGSGGIDACKILAEKFNTIVVATGPRDIITDGKRTVLVENGSSIMTLVSGTGCMLGALTTATAAVEKDFFKAALAAVVTFGLVGEFSAENLAGEILPGSFKVKLFDNIYRLSEDDLIKRGKITWL